MTSGANIAHDIAMMAGSSDLWARLGLSIFGIVLNRPCFWGPVPIGSEMVDLYEKEFHDRLWPFVCLLSPSNDAPTVSPVVNGAPSLAGLRCQRVLACLAEKDLMRDQGWLYYNVLGRSGAKGTVEMFEWKGEDHTFHLIDLASENAKPLLKCIAYFLKGDPSAD